MSAPVARKPNSPATNVWIVTEATIVSCRKSFLSGGIDETGQTNLASYIATFEYEVNSKRYRGRINRGTHMAIGHRFEISYDPMDPSRNTGSDYQVTWIRVVAWALGASLAALAVYLKNR